MDCADRRRVMRWPLGYLHAGAVVSRGPSCGPAGNRFGSDTHSTSPRRVPPQARPGLSRKCSSWGSSHTSKAHFSYGRMYGRFMVIVVRVAGWEGFSPFSVRSHLRERGVFFLCPEQEYRRESRVCSMRTRLSFFVRRAGARLQHSRRSSSLRCNARTFRPTH